MGLPSQRGFLSTLLGVGVCPPLKCNVGLRCGALSQVTQVPGQGGPRGRLKAAVRPQVTQSLQGLSPWAR